MLPNEPNRTQVEIQSIRELASGNPAWIDPDPACLHRIITLCCINSDRYLASGQPYDDNCPGDCSFNHRDYRASNPIGNQSISCSNGSSLSGADSGNLCGTDPVTHHQTNDNPADDTRKYIIGSTDSDAN